MRKINRKLHIAVKMSHEPSLYDQPFSRYGILADFGRFFKKSKRLLVGGKMGNFSMFIILIQIIKKMQKTLCCNFVPV